MISNAQESGFDPHRLKYLHEVLRDDIAAERYDGCVMLIARRGRVVFHEAAGFLSRACGRPLVIDNVFFSMSIAKQLTNAMVMMRVENGEIGLHTPVAQLIPAFGQKGKQHVTIGELMIHKGGLPLGLPASAAEHIGNIEALTEAACGLPIDALDRTRVSYSAVIAHSVLASVVRAIDGGSRSYRRMMSEDLFVPLGMRDTSLGARPDLVARCAPVVARDRTPDLFEAELLEGVAAAMTADFEFPAGGCLTTARDFFRFAECFRRGGELDGVRILSPSTVRLMMANQTGDDPNSLWDYAHSDHGWPIFPANLSYGFFLRGEGAWYPTPFGLTSSARTFGGFGAGSNSFWVDPERELVCVYLSCGLLPETKSVLRHQRIADLVQSAITQ